LNYGRILGGKPPVLLHGDIGKSILRIETPNYIENFLTSTSRNVILPCAVTSPKVSVALYKDGRQVNIQISRKKYSFSLGSFLFILHLLSTSSINKAHILQLSFRRVSNCKNWDLK